MESIFHDDCCVQSGGLSTHNSLPSPMSPIYDEDNLMDDSQGSLLEIMKSEFPYTGPSFWDAEPELSSDNMHLTPAEDFQKILSDWQEHLGAMQASDSDDLDVCCGQPFPDTIFDSDISLSAPPSASSCSSSNSRSLLKPRQERLATSGGNVYGMKAESQDARLPIMADDSDEEDQLKPILDIKIEFDDEDCVDVETVADQMPVLEAGDLKSLLEQFEASEAVNNPADMPPVAAPVSSLPAVSNSLLVLSNQKIRDSLPQEVVEKIKATSRKKVIPVIPAIPSKRLVTGTRMQDAAATLSRNKLLKIVAAGDTVQLDHDYCSSLSEVTTSQVSFYNCDSREYKSETEPSPAPLAEGDQQKHWEKNSKKDSGLESGEVSDASDETAPPTKLVVEAPPIKKKLNLQEYRSRREELERLKASSGKESSSAASSCISSPAQPSSPVAPTSKPEMHSVEVQTQDKAENNDSLTERPSRASHKSRQYRSHASEFHGRSSSGSSSSSTSHRRTAPRPKRRQRRSSSSSSSTSSSSRSWSSTKRRRRDSSLTWKPKPKGSVSSRSRNRSNSPASVTSSGSNGSCDWYPNGKDRQRQVEERRVIYVGRLPDGTSKVELRRRFELFGPIIDISVHFREHGDNYGFVTFAFKVDAYEAVEHGNDDPSLPKYDLCFGGRRTFCKVRYSDLDCKIKDGILTQRKNEDAQPRSKGGNMHNGDSFDHLLRETQAKLQKRGKKL